MAGEIEDVDGGFAFYVDERDLDVAVMGTEGEGDLAIRLLPAGAKKRAACAALS